MRVGAVKGTRRDVLRGVLVAAVAAVLAPFVAASRSSRVESSPAGGPPSGELSDELAEFEAEFASGFDEMYRGRRILGLKDAEDGKGVADAAGRVRLAGAARAAASGQWRVTVDDRPLHLMRRADGGFLTMVDHYASYPTPLAAARAAVDELGTLRLRAAAMESEPGEGHGHGVHA